MQGSKEAGKPVERRPPMSIAYLFPARTVIVAVLAALLAAAPLAADETDPQGPTADAVVAFVDTGINPYHVQFRDDSERAYEHPSTYLPGFPTDAEALELTLDAPDYWSAVRADCERVWRQVRPDTLYWFPGTKIVGAISFQNPGPVNCNSPQPGGMPILDSGGHGTMVASRGAASDYGACPECLVVSVQGFNNDSVGWAGEQAGWIDAQSNSWGAIVPLWEPTGVGGTLVNNPQGVRTYEEAAQRHLVFWASGNGLATRGGVLGLPPTTTDPRLTPSAIAVGGHDSGQVNTWPNFPPHVVSDSCDSWAARHRSVNESGDSVGGGTSAASPFAAGGAAATLREARNLLGDEATGVRDRDGTLVVAEGDPGDIDTGPLADGVLTLAEWKRLVFVTATPRPERQEEDGPPCPAGLYGPTPVEWSEVPEDYPEYLHIGYGAIDRPALALAARVLRGETAAPDRSDTDVFFTADGAARGAAHQVYRGP